MGQGVSEFGGNSEVSFEHRFGVGIGGSHEDPYIPPWCEACPTAVYNRCPRTPEFIEECMEFSTCCHNIRVQGEQRIMPALSFSGTPSRGPFWKLILDGEKRQTVRLPRKRPIKRGDFLKLYWKQRIPADKKECHFIGPAKCTHVETVKKHNFLFNREFARKDGFSSELELQDWFGVDNYDETYVVIHFEVIRSCMGCYWCQPLTGVYVCAQSKGRFSIVESEFDKDPRNLGCYEIS